MTLFSNWLTFSRGGWVARLVYRVRQEAFLKRHEDFVFFFLVFTGSFFHTFFFVEVGRSSGDSEFPENVNGIRRLFEESFE